MANNSPSLDIAKKLIGLTGPQKITQTTSSSIWDILAQLAMMSYFMMPQKAGSRNVATPLSGSSGAATDWLQSMSAPGMNMSAMNTMTPDDLVNLLRSVSSSLSGGIR